MTRLQTLYLAIASVCSLALSGCALGDIDVAAVGPPNLYWVKRGVSPQMQEADMVSCVRGKERPLIDVINDQDECLLKKGYTFIPRPPGYRNVCTVGGLRDEFACRVWRGEITVQPDEPAPPPPKPQSAPTTPPNYDQLNPPSSILQDAVTRQSNQDTNQLLRGIKR
jgi:hypothetical protein